MAVIPKRRTVNLWFIQYVGDRLIDLNGQLVTTGNDIASVYIIGTWLSGPFITMAYMLNPIIGYLNDLQIYLDDKLGYLLGIIDGVSYEDLMNWYSTELPSLRYDFRGALISKLLGILPDAYNFLYNTRNWFNGYINSISDNLSNIINNPTSFILNILYSQFAFLWSFFNNPSSYIFGILRFYIPFLDPFRLNPLNWILSLLFTRYVWLSTFFNSPYTYIYSLLFGGYLWFSQFLTNPQDFILGYVRLYFGLSPSDDTDLGTALLRMIMNRLYNFVVVNESFFKNLVIAIIKRFL